MKKVDKDLDQIIGGTDFSATMINAFVNVLKLLIDAGKGVGSSIRRIAEDNVCPLQ